MEPLSTAVGALGAALTTSVGTLALMSRRYQKRNGGPTSADIINSLTQHEARSEAQRERMVDLSAKIVALLSKISEQNMVNSTKLDELVRKQ